MKTIEALKIFWPIEINTESGQEEVDGLIFYGAWRSKNKLPVQFDKRSFQELWQEFDIETNFVEWEGDENADLSIDVWVKEWRSDAWLDTLVSCFSWLSTQGAYLASCGPLITGPAIDSFDASEFISESFESEIYAACNPLIGMRCNSDLHEEYKGLSKDDLRDFWAIVQGKND